jgi:hypothetical protein
VNPTFFADGVGILNVATASCNTGTWLGGTSSDWFDANNWCGGVVPTATDNVTISSGTANSPVINAPELFVII